MVEADGKIHVTCEYCSHGLRRITQTLEQRRLGVEFRSSPGEAGITVQRRRAAQHRAFRRPDAYSPSRPGSGSAGMTVGSKLH